MTSAAGLPAHVAASPVSTRCPSGAVCLARSTQTCLPCAANGERGPVAGRQSPSGFLSVHVSQEAVYGASGAYGDSRRSGGCKEFASHAGVLNTDAYTPEIARTNMAVGAFDVKVLGIWCRSVGHGVSLVFQRRYRRCSEQHLASSHHGPGCGCS